MKWLISKFSDNERGVFIFVGTVSFVLIPIAIGAIAYFGVN
jgi:hypothetical protein